MGRSIDAESGAIEAYDEHDSTTERVPFQLIVGQATKIGSKNELKSAGILGICRSTG